MPRDGDTSVTVRIAYDVGSRRDPEGLGGLAHVLEHLMFDGSPTIGPASISRQVRDVDGRNAITDWDLTDCIRTIPPGAFDRVLTAEADRMRGVALSDDGLATQLASIEEEEALHASRTCPTPSARQRSCRWLWAGTLCALAPRPEGRTSRDPSRGRRALPCRALRAGQRARGRGRRDRSHGGASKGDRDASATSPRALPAPRRPSRSTPVRAT
ncbi:MAG: insulinase family protein [Myxococcota bacterium]